MNLDYEGKVFVYGREVSDFHVVDYEALSTLNISATQALAKKMMAMEQVMEVLKQENEDLKADVKAVKALEQRLAQIEELLGAKAEK